MASCFSANLFFHPLFFPILDGNNPVFPLLRRTLNAPIKLRIATWGHLILQGRRGIRAGCWSPHPFFTIIPLCHPPTRCYPSHSAARWLRCLFPIAYHQLPVTLPLLWIHNSPCGAEQGAHSTCMYLDTAHVALLTDSCCRTQSLQLEKTPPPHHAVLGDQHVPPQLNGHRSHLVPKGQGCARAGFWLETLLSAGTEGWRDRQPSSLVSQEEARSQ